jgi:hypothetical protein
MARFTTTSRGKLDFAINVLLKFYNPVISINRIMTNGTVRASRMLCTRTQGFRAHSMTGIACNLGLIHQCPFGSGGFAALKGGAMTVGIGAACIAIVPGWLGVVKLGPGPKLDLGSSIDMTRGIN